MTVRTRVASAAGAAGAAGALALLVAPLAAQNQRASQPAQRRHLAALHAERCERFFERYEAADDGRRAAVVALLRDLETSPRANRSWPSAGDLVFALRVLDGAEPDALRGAGLARLADDLDLQVVPGVFEPVAEGESRGEPLTVRVWPHGPMHVNVQADVSLVWIAPDGTETVARTEPVAPAAMRKPGFDMYLRAPAVRAGAARSPERGEEGWRLVPEVEIGGERRRGFPVPVACVPDFAARLAALGEPADASGPLARLRALHELGTRTAGALAPGALLAALEDPSGADGPAPRPLDDHVLGADDRLDWIVRPAGEPRGLLVVVAPVQQAPGALLGGPIGRRWIDAAARSGHVLLSVALGERPGTTLAAGLEALRARHAPGLPLTLVLRGDAVTQTQMLAFLGGAEAPRVDGLVLGLEAAPSSFPVEASRTLVVLPQDAEGADREDPPEGWSVAVGGPTSFLTEPLLPDLVAGWLEP